MTSSGGTRPSTDSFDAVIIGGRILGCSIALELTRRKKLTVCVVEKMREVEQGSTAWCCGIARTHYSTESGITLGNESIRYWQNWADHLGARDPLGLCEHRQVGSAHGETRGLIKLRGGRYTTAAIGGARRPPSPLLRKTECHARSRRTHEAVDGEGIDRIGYCGEGG
jgi:glycine/D-amino acid oxidase-like deaminating enzyme